MQNLSAQTLSQIPDIGEITSSITGQFGNLQSLLGKAGGLIGALSGNIANLINDIKTYGNLSGIIKSLAKSLSSFQQQLLSLPEQIAKSMLSQISGLENTVGQFLSANPFASKGTLKHLNKKIRKTKDFFGKPILDELKAKVNTFFDQNTQQFEDLLPAVLNFLLLKACGLAQLLESLMRAPVDRLRGLIGSTTNNFDVMSNYSNGIRNHLIENGAIRIPPAQRYAEAQQGVENVNRSRNSGTGTNSELTRPRDYVKPAISPQEYKLVTSAINGRGMAGSFVFGPGVNTMGKQAQDFYNNNKNKKVTVRYPKTGNIYEHRKVWNPDLNYHDSDRNVDSGWKFITDNNPTLFIMLHRVAQKLKRQGNLSGDLTINSAFRSPYYNYFVLDAKSGKGAEKSNHMKGMAFDISLKGLNSSEDRAAFIRACSEEGFVRIVRYSSFFHIDVGPGSRKGHWTSKGNMSSAEREVWEMHSDGKFS